MKKKYYKGVAYYPVDWVEKKFADDKAEIDDLFQKVLRLEKEVLAKKEKPQKAESKEEKKERERKEKEEKEKKESE